MYLLLPITSFVLTLVLLEAFFRIDVLARIQDIPNERSLHERPVPRIGGLALMAGALAAFAIQPSQIVRTLLVPTLFLIAVSVIDDIRGLSAGWRLFAHIAAATLFAVKVFLPTFGWSVPVLVVLAIVWMTNLYNFMDGSDGLAGGMTLIGFSAYGVVGLMHDNTSFALLCFCIAASALAFLRYNFSPARVFMGDAGSIPLGFLAAALGLIGWQDDFWPAWFPVLVFSPFVIDASVTLLKRFVRGDRIADAHKEHYYQRLVQMGWVHKKTAIGEYMLMVSVGCSAIWAISVPPLQQFVLIGAWVAIYFAAFTVIDIRWSKHSPRRSAVAGRK